MKSNENHIAGFGRAGEATRFDERIGMQFPWQSWVLEKTDANDLGEVSLVQGLWGGYGQLLRVSLLGGQRKSAILKYVVCPTEDGQTESDRRKRRSYEVERAWYRNGAPHCRESCRVAHLLAEATYREGSLLLLEDLNEAGYQPTRQPSLEQLRSALEWLARFHVIFLDLEPQGLWEQGSYWHLDTRREEWNRSPSGPLTNQAEKLHNCMQASKFKTVLHGDPKAPNFCWKGSHPAAVDFQYVGRGCGIRDVCLLVSRCMERHTLDEANRWLAVYFTALKGALETRDRADIFAELEADWRGRFPVAWADYARFCVGWSPGYRPDRFTLEMLERALRLCSEGC